MSFVVMVFFVFKQKTAYEVRISDWSSDVCSSDLGGDDHEVDAGRLEVRDRDGELLGAGGGGGHHLDALHLVPGAGQRGEQGVVDGESLGALTGQDADGLALEHALVDQVGGVIGEDAVVAGL